MGSTADEFIAQCSTQNVAVSNVADKMRLFSSNEAAQKAALDALFASLPQLDQANVQGITEAAAAALLRHRSSRVHQAGVQLLHALSASDKFKAAVVRSDGAKAVLHALQTCPMDAELASLATSSLSCMTLELGEDLFPAILNQTTSAMTRHESARVHVNGIGVLNSLCTLITDAACRTVSLFDVARQYAPLVGKSLRTLTGASNETDAAFAVSDVISIIHAFTADDEIVHALFDASLLADFDACYYAHHRDLDDVDRDRAELIFDFVRAYRDVGAGAGAGAAPGVEAAQSQLREQEGQQKEDSTVGILPFAIRAAQAAQLETQGALLLLEDSRELVDLLYDELDGVTDERDTLLQQQRALEDALEERSGMWRGHEPDDTIAMKPTARRTPSKAPAARTLTPDGCEVVPLDGVAVRAIKRTLGLEGNEDSTEATEHLYFQISSASECLAKYVYASGARRDLAVSLVCCAFTPAPFSTRSWRCLCLNGERGSDGIPSRRVRRLMQHTILAKTQQASSLADLDVVLHKLSPGHNDLSFAQFCHVVIVTTVSILKTRSSRKPEPSRVLSNILELLAAYINREGRELDPLQLAGARAAFQQQLPRLEQLFASYGTELEPEMPPVLTKARALALAKDFELTTLLSWNRIESLWRYLVNFGDFSMSTLPAGQGEARGEDGEALRGGLISPQPPRTLRLCQVPRR